MLARETIFTSNSRLPCLDGWRAVAIAIVLGAHSKYADGFPSHLDTLFTWLFDGHLGVRFFFVISGFLITLLMLRENHHRGFSLRRFWLRRVLRIFPVYFVYLLFLCLLQFQTEFRMTPVQWCLASTFTWNYEYQRHFITQHLWSLCVEEQFYFVWPLAFSAIGKKFRLLGVLVIIVIAAAAILRVVGYVTEMTAFKAWSLLTNMDSLAVGGLFAYLAFFQGYQLITLTRLWPFIVAALMMILFPYLMARLFLLGKIMVPLGPLSQSIGFGILMVASIVRSNSSTTVWLRWTPVAWIGTLSYSLYIWQQVFCWPRAPYVFADVWCFRFPFWIFGALFAAIASFYLIEKPFLRLKRFFEH